MTLFYIFLVFRELANKVWDLAKLNCHLDGLCEDLLGDVVHPVSAIQEAGAHALAELLKQSNPQLTEVTLGLLLNIYKEKLAVRIFLSILKFCKQFASRF